MQRTVRITSSDHYIGRRSPALSSRGMVASSSPQASLFGLRMLAAGGIADGRGLAAALMLGADGVWVGTRFLASTESAAHDNHKEKILAADERDTVVSRSYTGKPSRILRNVFTQRWQDREADVLPMPWQRSWMAPLVAPAKGAGLTDIANFPTGQVAGRITSISPAAEIVREMVAEAQDVLAHGPPMRLPS